jgi:hypothetical protein
MDSFFLWRIHGIFLWFLFFCLAVVMTYLPLALSFFFLSSGEQNAESCK